MEDGSHALPDVRTLAGWRTIESTTGWPRLAVGEFWRHRELLGFFLWRDVKVRYKQTLLGVAWAVLQPAATVTIFSVVFGRWAHLQSDGAPYPAFCLAGLLPWMLFATGVTSAANSLVGNVNLITKVYFPRVLLPLSNVLAALVDFGAALFMALAVLGWYGTMPSVRLLLLPLPIVLVLATAAGAGLWLAALNARYRDVRHALPFLVQLWMYSTPIVYSLALVPPGWRSVAALNPLLTAVQCFRCILLGAPAPALGLVTISTCAALALLATGLTVFHLTERSVADTI
ncbi:MAG TPA: ABC transporter permease [Pirellulales bacterium]|nr:ABC transporter permease [Pirellulales bacterium]